MTQRGDRFAFPDGTRWLVEQAPGDSADGAVVFKVNVPPSVFSPPPHRHPKATDSYEVLEGSFSVQVDGQWRTLKQGDRADVPPGTVHTLANRSGAETVVRNTHSPASGFDEFVARADRLMRTKHHQGQGRPGTDLVLDAHARVSEHLDSGPQARRRDNPRVRIARARAAHEHSSPIKSPGTPGGDFAPTPSFSRLGPHAARPLAGRNRLLLRRRRGTVVRTAASGAERQPRIPTLGGGSRALPRDP